jgi:DNA-binding NtrC family response regulator
MSAAGASVLIVDDDRDICTMLRDILTADGFRVRTARDGTVGLRLLHQHYPDVVLLDVEMPRLGGPEMAHQMLVHDAGMENIPIVLASGVADLAEVARRMGTPYFLTKPYELDDLLELLQRALNERRGGTSSASV